MNPEEQRLVSILAEAGTIAVVGLSDDPSRTSHRIAAYMQEAGYRVIPINPQNRFRLRREGLFKPGRDHRARRHRERLPAFAGNTRPGG